MLNQANILILKLKELFNFELNPNEIILSKEDKFSFYTFQTFSINLSHLKEIQERFFSLEIQPKLFFQRRENGYSYFGIGSLSKVLENNLDSLYSLAPEDLVFFHTQKFHQKSYVTLPIVQIQVSPSDTKFIISIHQDEYKELEQISLALTNHLNPSDSNKSLVHDQVHDQKESLLGFMHNPNCEAWNELFLKIASDFKSNLYRKIVPARVTTLSLSKPIFPFHFFQKVQAPNCYNFYMEQEQGSIFLGSSPEKLFSHMGSTFETEAIAGTRPLNQAEELLTSEKDLKEHRLVVEDILEKIREFTTDLKNENLNGLALKTPPHDLPISTRNSPSSIESSTKSLLTSHAPSNLKEDFPKIIKYKNIAHLKTDIQKEIKPSLLNTSHLVLTLINKLSPTSAICGMPKESALLFLKQNEPFEREYYSTPFGIFNRKFSDICVSIRSCKIKNNQISLYAGVGVVPESIASDEWEELNYKIMPYLEILSEITDQKDLIQKIQSSKDPFYQQGINKPSHKDQAENISFIGKSI